jgi:hypothetical protein
LPEVKKLINDKSDFSVLINQCRKGVPWLTANHSLSWHACFLTELEEVSDHQGDGSIERSEGWGSKFDM